MVARTGEVHEPDIAVDHDGFGLARNTRKPKTRSKFALIHDALAGKIRVFGEMNDEPIKVARIFHDPANDAGIADWPRAIAEGHGASKLQQADLGNLCPIEACAQ